MNGPDGKPTKPDDDFEPLAPVRPSHADPFGELSPELRDRIRRASEDHQKWEDDPANTDEAKFWLEVPFRETKLKAMKVQAENVAAPDAVALAMRNAMLFHIDKAIDALRKDEEEVRSALPAKKKATLEQVRRRWDRRDSIAAGLIAAEHVQGRAERSRVPAVVDVQPAGVLGSVVNQSDVRSQDTPQSAPLALIPSHADRPKATIPALAEWFRGRVATWPDTEAAPSEPDDVRAAIYHFAPGLTRDEVRTIRRVATPCQWRRQGRRKPWGDVKPKSAE